MTKIGGVIYKKLRRRNALGLVEDGSDLIHIDPRLKGLKQLEILIHEGSHILNNSVQLISSILARHGAVKLN